MNESDIEKFLGASLQPYQKEILEGLSKKEAAKKIPRPLSSGKIRGHRADYFIIDDPLFEEEKK